MASPDEELRIVLVGKTGVGKSSTGNTILGSQVFGVSASGSAVTLESTYAVAYEFGRRVVVVDTPGLFDRSISNEEIVQTLSKTIALLSPGFHCLAYVMTPGRFTPEDEKTIDYLVHTFGPEMYKKTIIIVTRKHSIKKEFGSVETYLETCGEKLKEFIQKCSGRVMLFSNKSKHESKVNKQVEELICMIEEIEKKSSRQEMKPFINMEKFVRAAVEIGQQFGEELWKESVRQQRQKSLQAAQSRVKVHEVLREMESASDEVVEEENKNIDRDKFRRAMEQPAGAALKELISDFGRILLEDLQGVHGKQLEQIRVIQSQLATRRTQNASDLSNKLAKLDEMIPCCDYIREERRLVINQLEAALSQLESSKT